MALLMGIDIGTTRIKSLLFDLNGKVVSQASQDCPLIRPREGWVEQDPDQLWQALLTTMREAMAQASKAYHEVLGLSLSTQGGTTIPVDEAGNPIRNAISWMDRRGEMIADELECILDPEAVYHFSGWRFSGELPLGHVAWLRRYEPVHYEATRYFLQVNDFLIHRLTGELYQDPSNAGITQLYNILEDKWDERALAAVGITQEQLSPIAPSGQAIGPLTADAAGQMGLSTETWVMNGAHDQYAAALGAGVIEPGQVLLSCGTAWVLLVTTAEPTWGTGAGAMSVSRHAVPGRWGALRSMGGVGTTVEWYVDTILAPHAGFSEEERGEAFEIMNQELPQVPIGARGLFCFPLGGGHTSQEMGRRGTLWGLTASHSKYDIGRAVLEGIAFELRWLIELVQSEQIPIHSLVTVGGASQSSCWPQIIADVTGLPVTVPAIQEAGARGAALLAGIGLGCFSFEEGLQAARGGDCTVEPRKDARRVYDGLFYRYQIAFNAFRDSFRRSVSDWRERHTQEK